MKFSLSIILSMLIHWTATACELSVDKAYLAEYKWLTEDYPPYNYTDESGVVVGIFSDVLVSVYEELEIKFDRNNISIVPWARLYHAIQNDIGFAGFSMANNPEREKLFTLVPLPIVTKTSIMALSEKKPQLLKVSVNDLTIAVVRQDVGQLRLNKANIVARQIETISAFSMLKMLIHKRVDAIAYAEDVAHFQYNQLELTEDLLVPLYVLDDKSLASYAFSKKTPLCITDLFAKTINKLHLRGDIQSIKDKYITK